MRNSPLLFLLAPALALALARVPVPGPVGPQGEKILLGASEVIEDGTLVAGDSSGRYWWTRDQGAHWDSIPALDTLEGTEFVGSALRGGLSLDLIWRWSTGWTKPTIPSACQGGLSSVSSAGFLAAIASSRPDRIAYCRSTDGLLTWTDWFDLDTGSVPWRGTSRLGRFADGMVWFQISDSGRLRGTSDGRDWSRVDLPEGWTKFEVDPRLPGLSLMRTAGDSAVELATTRDTGRTWNIRSPLRPGDWIVPAADHLFWSVTIDPSDRSRKLWVAAAEGGPWELATTNVQMYPFSGQVSPGVWTWAFHDGDTPYLVDSTGINRLVLEGTATLRRPARIGMAGLDRTGTVRLDLPDSRIGSTWAQLGLDGRTLASGRLARPGLELALRSGPTLLRIGASTWKLPPRMR